MEKFYMYQNFYFVGMDKFGAYHLTEKPTQPNIKIPDAFLARYETGELEEVDRNYVSKVYIEKDEVDVESLVLYHVTMDDYLKDVMAHGLVPKRGRLSQIIGETEEKVYLFPNEDEMETALGNWMGESYEEIAEEDGIEFEDLLLHSLKIKVPVNKFRDAFEESMVGYEFLCNKTIPKEWIEYHSEQ